MKKIIIIGSGGAGKSTLAKQLGQKLELPVIHLDALFWRPGWDPMPKPEFLARMQEIMKSSQWIIDGNFGSTMDDRLQAADTIIFLHYSRYVCIQRALKRRIMYHNKTRPDMGEGCAEKIDPTFLKWIWDYPEEKAPQVLDKLVSHSLTKNIIILRSPKQTNKWIQSINSRKLDFFKSYRTN